ncbi:AGE family epimerase/isomerase [Nocardioides aurantiacus]|uniref:AGE family epimerase/isomerase n=1 Tax=Nocardioides aurantiacus TaxID=86796 RepID=UPI00403F4AF6
MTDRAGAAGAAGAPGTDAWLAAELDRLLDFAEAAADPDGGFAYLDDDGRPVPGRPLELWITCRMTHVFALGHLLGRPGAGALADVGLAGLRGRFHDAEHGGWWAQVDADGPVTTAKTAYEHAFVVLAASSATAAGRPGAGELLADAVAVLLDHFWDDGAGMLVEEWDAAWTTLDGYRGVNANMHGVEALLAAADVLDDPALRERARRVTTRVVRDLAPAHDWRIPEHFDDSWTPLPDYHHDQPAHPFRPYGATVGHWLEWSRLTLHLRAALTDATGEAPGWMLEHAVTLFDAAVREGWHADRADGFVYTVDWDGRPVVRERMHWVVTEAIAAAAALHRATGEASYAAHETAWWEYAAAHLVDTERGSWRHELDADNRPSAATWAGKPDVYHAVGATLVPRLPLSPTASVALRDGLAGG